MAQELGEKLLQHLSKCDTVNTLELSKILETDHQKIIGALNSIIATSESMVKAEPKSEKIWELTEEGALVAKNGEEVLFTTRYYTY